MSAFIVKPSKWDGFTKGPQCNDVYQHEGQTMHYNKYTTGVNKTASDPNNNNINNNNNSTWQEEEG